MVARKLLYVKGREGPLPTRRLTPRKSCIPAERLAEPAVGSLVATKDIDDEHEAIRCDQAIKHAPMSDAQSQEWGPLDGNGSRRMGVAFEREDSPSQPREIRLVNRLELLRRFSDEVYPPGQRLLAK